MKRRIARLALALGALGACASPAVRRPAASVQSTPQYVSRLAEPTAPPTLRLPDDVRPTRCKAALTVVPTESTFEGAVECMLEVERPTSTIWMNADGLTVRHAAANRKAPARIIEGNANFVGFAFDRELPVGPVVLSVVYQGKLSDKETDGASRQREGSDWYVYTHFEPLAARRVFPSFDEPKFKVPWQLTLRVKKSDIALANTPVSESTDETGEFRVVRFAETKPLPTYLLAFAVGPFEVVDAGKAGQNATPVRVITPRGKSGWARYAAESTGPVLALLEKYFASPYPYEKLDVIAVPLFGGAMENPGLITFGQSLILSKPTEESVGFKRAYASVTAHELAHQWFGDLVTTAWWDDLWLNEAFATWATPKIMAQYRPDWDAAAGRAQSASGAMRTDSLVTARQIRQPILTNDDIKNAFDGITYSKGAAVARMFERFIGEEVFQRGVQRYMREHAHKTATAKDFLAAISAEAGRDIAPAFSTFLDQPGVPLVTATLSCGPQGAKLNLAQSRYLPEGSEGAARGQLWKIPFCVRFGGQGRGPAIRNLGAPQQACTVLEGETGELALPYCPAWVMPNAGADGYYRVALEEGLVRKLSQNLRELTAPERISLFGDLAALARAGRIDYGTLLAMVPTLAADRAMHVVETTIGPVAGLREASLFTPAQRPKYAKFVRDVYGARARALGFKNRDGEDDETRRLRPALVGLVADEGEDLQFTAEATKLARAWLVDRTAIDPGMVGMVLRIAATTGDDVLFQAYLAEAKHAAERVDRNRLLWALGSFRKPAVIESALALTLDQAFDPRESIQILWAVAQTPDTLPQAYAFVTKNFDALASRLPRDYGGSFVRIGASLCDDGRREEISAFFKGRATHFVGGPRTFAQSLETLHLCSIFRQNQGPKVEAYLKKR